MGESEVMASSVILKVAKKELRSLMKQKLSNIQTDSIDAQSAAVHRSITSFMPYREAKRIGIYLSMPTGEIQTDAIVRHALNSGKRVFIPYLHKSRNPPPDTPRSVMDMVDIHSQSDYEALKRDSWGIPTVDEASVDHREHILENSGAKNEGLDMILMPGVAFDTDPETGYVRRLGHGKGFYDYFLHSYKLRHDSHMDDLKESPGTGILLYGLALEEQYLHTTDGSSVPVGEQDNLLHGLVLGNGGLIQGPRDRITDS